MSDWQVEFLDQFADVDGVTVSDGAFAAGPAVWVGSREVAHFDGERTLDVRLTKTEIRSRRAELKADERVSLRRAGSDWLEVDVSNDDDAGWAASLVRDAISANRPTAPAGLPPTGPALDRRRRFH